MHDTPVKKHHIGNMFRVVGDPFYCDQKTVDDVRNVLTDIYHKRSLTSKRIRVWYGNVETGRAWNDMFNVCGYVGRNMDRYPRPTVMQFKSSIEGEVLATNKIVRIDIVESGETVYSHEKFHIAPFSTLSNITESAIWQRLQRSVARLVFRVITAR